MDYCVNANSEAPLDAEVRALGTVLGDGPPGLTLRKPVLPDASHMAAVTFPDKGDEWPITLDEIPPNEDSLRSNGKECTSPEDSGDESGLPWTRGTQTHGGKKGLLGRALWSPLSLSLLRSSTCGDQNSGISVTTKHDCARRVTQSPGV